jgi:hypothetical protein
VNVGGGYRKPSGILSALSRNRVHGSMPTPKAPVGQTGVSPIIRTMPAKVLYANTGTTPRQPGVRSVQLEQQENGPQILNVGAVAAGTAAPMYAPSANGTPQANFGPVPQQSHPLIPAYQQLSGVMGAADGAHPNLQMLVPALRSMIVQALAARRPPSWPGQGMGGRLI